MKRIIITTFAASLAFLLSSFSLPSMRADEVRDLAPFDGIGISVSADVYYIQGNTHEIRIEGDQSDIKDLITEVKNGFLEVKYDNWRIRHSKVTLYITSEELEKVKISGSADFMVEKPLSSDEMELGLSGSGSIKFNRLESDEVDVAISGSGSAEIDGGSADEIDIRISGSGKLLAENFEVSECDASISGSGGVRITVEDELNARLSGSGRIHYGGNPRVNSVASGSGKVVAL
jgi:hypothetical protein